MSAQLRQSDHSKLLIIAVSLYVSFRLLSVTRDDLWVDEVFSVLTIRHDWAQMLSVVIKDGVHPPLFYVLLKVWSLVNPSVWWLQLFPFLVSILTIFPLYLLCRELKLTRAETAVVFLTIAVNGYFLEYALDLRMYGLLQFFTLFSVRYFIKLSRANEDKLAIVFILTFFNLLLVYTHYFGWLIVGLEGLYLIVRQRRLFYVFAAGSTTCLLCFAPWIFFVLQNAVTGQATGNLDWLTRPTLSEIAWFYTVLNGNLYFPHTTFASLLIFGAPICFTIWRAVSKKKFSADWQFLFFFAVAPVILIFTLSLVLPKSVWDARYLIIAAAAYNILFVKSAFALPGKISRILFVGAILAWSLTAGFYGFSQMPKKIQWSDAAAKIAGGSALPNITQKVYVFENWVGLPLRFYLNESNVSARVEQRNEPGEIDEKNYWLALRLPKSEERLELPEMPQNKNCSAAEKHTFSDGWQTVVLLRVENCY